MKHILQNTLLIVILFFGLSIVGRATELKASPVDSVATVSITAEQELANQVMIQRLEEIKAMDKSDLSRTEKRALRQEVKTIKHDLTLNGGGVYVSVGALLIIILLLIILL